MLKRLATLLLLVVAASACTLGPEPERPTTAADEARSFAHAETPTVNETSVSPWWREFGDPATAELVELALANNTDLQTAAARVLEAESMLKKSTGALWPQVDYQVSGNRSKVSFVLPDIGRRDIYSTTYSADIGVSYQLDLFGKLRRSRQSAWASMLAAEAARETVQHAVIAGVVRGRVAVANAERALAIARQIRVSWEQTLATVERRYRSGLVGAVDVHLARENLAATRASEEVLEAAVEVARLSLDVLVGRRPGSGPVLPDTLADLPDLDPVPAGLPIALLDRRPDLVDAEMQLAAATYGIGIALADLYPNISLSASGGTASDVVGDLIDADSIVYNVIGSIAGPIFSGGSRKAEVRAARARAEAAAATYAGSVLRALEEVERALVSDQSNRERLEHTQRRLAEAQAADALARERYQRGVETFLTVLETERRLRAAEEAMITTKVDLWNTRIDLFLALGGDWAPEAATAPDQSERQARSDLQYSETDREVSP
jgi:multidrug efflux system outer membrane protein